MAKQVGALKLTGPMGGVSYYKRNGQYYAREKTGPNPDTVRTSPRFARTRENAKEFRRAIRAGMLVRHSLKPLVKDLRLSDNHISGRLNALLNKVEKSDLVSDRGERTVTKGQVEMLEDFAFQKDKTFSSVFAAGPVSSIDTDTGRMKVELRPFDPRERIHAPEGATHFTIVASAAAIDFDKERWNQVCKTTGHLPLEEYMDQPICLEHLLAPAQGEYLLLTIGVVFYVQHGDGHFERVAGGVMKILQVSEPRSRQVGTSLGGIERIGRKEETVTIVDLACRIPDSSLEQHDEATRLQARAIPGKAAEKHDNETLAVLLQCLNVKEAFALFPT